ncbi:MAG: hypothetical protein K6T83_20315 [Alicyclobacillus sp.]|nr:hypothetical protein [Alicyclobacillus sp.]
MKDYTLTLVESVREFAEEVEATGLRTDALKRAVEQYNEARNRLASSDADNPIWQQIPTLEPDAVTASELSLYCGELLHIAAQEQEDEVIVWHIDRRTILQGSFNGIILVHPDCEFVLQGHVKGTIALLGKARMIWQGTVKGVVEQSPESEIQYQGNISAKIVTVPNLEEKYKEYLNPEVV